MARFRLDRVVVPVRMESVGGKSAISVTEWYRWSSLATDLQSL